MLVSFDLKFAGDILLFMAGGRELENTPMQGGKARVAGAWTAGLGLGWTREPRGAEFSTLNCRARKMMDPFQGGVETSEI